MARLGPGAARIGNGAIALDVAVDDGFRLVGISNRRSGRYLEVAEPASLALALSAAKARIPIACWRMNLSSPQRESNHLEELGYRAGYHRPGLDDSDWYEVEFLYGTSYRRVRGTPDRFDGYGWFRQTFDLPGDAEGEEIVLVLGGYDQHDWNEYWIYLNGWPVGHRLATSVWREPATVVLAPGAPEYAALRFGVANLVAVQTCNLRRARPDMRDEDTERYLFNSALADQFVAIGQPYQWLSSYAVLEWANEGGARLRGRLRETERGLLVTVTYEVRGDEPAFRKWVEIENPGPEPATLLDVVVLELRGNFATGAGGRGYPVYVDDEIFAGLEHPAGINQGFGSALRLWHCPGRSLAPGESLRSQTAVVGCGRPGEGRSAFTDYLERNGRRRPEVCAIWSTEGVHDYPFAPRWEEQVVPEHKMLAVLDWMAEAQQRQGRLFDYFVLDVGWQDHAGDLTAFHREFWPHGPGAVVQRANDLGMKFGLWFSGTRAAWSCGENPAVAPSFVPRPRREVPEYRFQPSEGPPGRTWERYPQLCPASEPYRSILRKAILHHIRENQMRLVKIDTSHYVCHSTAHDHLPGKYSTEAMMDAIIAITEEARAACPDIFIMWYWGHSSPFWALFGSTIFECGVFMEASNVSTHPSIFYRDSVTTYLDEGTWFADQIPPLVKDSLGVWIGHVQWANWMGKDDWRDAWIADLGRGSLLAQLWGNVFLFDEDDARFLAESLAWLRRHADWLAHPIHILGDPWRGEPYGNLHLGPERAVIVAHNPTFADQRVELRLDERLAGGGAGGWKVARRYPDRARFARAGGYAPGDVLTWWLRPFEVALLELQRQPPGEGDPAETLDPAQPPANPSRPLGFSLAEQGRGASGRVLGGHAELPALSEPTTVAVVLRFWRGGRPWRCDVAHELLEIEIACGGRALPATTVPARRVWKASNWLVAKGEVGSQQAGERLELRLAARLPDEVELSWEGWLVPQWWKQVARPAP